MMDTVFRLRLRGSKRSSVTLNGRSTVNATDSSCATDQRKTFLCLLSCLTLGLWNSSTVWAQAIPPQTLNLGESTTIATDYEIGDVAITNPAVADFTVPEDRRQIYLNAKGEGFATLTLWDQEGNPKEAVPITVYGFNLKNIYDEAKRAFGASGTIQFLAEGNSLRLLGEASSPSMMKQVEAFAAKHPEVINEVTVAEPVLETMTAAIEKAIALPGIKVRSVRNQIVLEGIAYSRAQADKAFAIAKLYAPDCLNLIEVRDKDRTAGKEKMVQLDFYFMEIQKSALRIFGIQWAPGSFPKDGSGVGGLGQSLVGFVFNLIPKIRFAREKGLGRVLENPTLFVKSGDKGQFFSGIQVPYFAREAVEFKEVGVKIEVEPIVSGNDVDIQLTATLSSPSPHIEGGIHTHTVSTTAYVPADQAFVLGGIVSNRDVKTTNRIPKDLMTSSALFTLFLSKDFQTSRSELAVFVLPRIVDQPALAVTAKEDFENLAEEIIRDRSRRDYAAFMKKKGREGNRNVKRLRLRRSKR